MRIVALPFTFSDLQREIARTKVSVLAWAAMLTDLLTAGPLSRALKALIVAILRGHAAEVRAAIHLQTWILLRQPPGRRAAIRHPPGAPHGCRVRVEGDMIPIRAIDRRAFRGAGLESRDPQALAAAILAVIADARRWIVRMARVLCGGFKPGDRIIGAPFVRIRRYSAADVAPSLADSS